MKLRTVFVTDRKQVHIPEGWEIDTVILATPPKGKPEYAVLLKKKPPEKEKQMGFKTR